MDSDIVIIGAGIAGLRCGIEVLHKRPKATVIILEKYKYIGGRVVTYRKTLQTVKGKCTELQWENGAGRVHTSHTKVLNLVKRYKLHTIPLSSDQMYVDEGEIQENKFEQLLELFLPSIQNFTPEILSKYTLRQLFQILLKGNADTFLLQFPYRAEVDTLRADMAIESFQREMGTYSGYVVVQEGLSELIDGMTEEFIKLGGQIFLQHAVTDIVNHGSRYLIKATSPNGDIVWEADKVICALHSEALKQIPCFQSWVPLQHLKMEPLLRVYAVFPSEKGKSWFTGIPRSVSPGLIRYFIPINPACGIVMLSYTDGKDARLLEKLLEEKGEEALETALMKAIREMFPSHEIPESLFFKAHPWSEGCTYWLPGSYSPEQVSKEALQPFPETMPNLHCCGESFSLRQAWMEGALEHADELLKKFF
jgi:monoamine oxidase